MGLHILLKVKKSNKMRPPPSLSLEKKTVFFGIIAKSVLPPPSKMWFFMAKNTPFGKFITHNFFWQLLLIEMVIFKHDLINFITYFWQTIYGSVPPGQSNEQNVDYFFNSWNSSVIKRFDFFKRFCKLHSRNTFVLEHFFLSFFVCPKFNFFSNSRGGNRAFL